MPVLRSGVRRGRRRKQQEQEAAEEEGGVRCEIGEYLLCPCQRGVSDDAPATMAGHGEFADALVLGGAHLAHGLDAFSGVCRFYAIGVTNVALTNDSDARGPLFDAPCDGVGHPWTALFQNIVVGVSDTTVGCLYVELYGDNGTPATLVGGPCNSAYLRRSAWIGADDQRLTRPNIVACRNYAIGVGAECVRCGPDVTRGLADNSRS